MRFVHIPRTGGTTICRVFGLKDTHTPWAWRFEREEGFANDGFRFSVVRNPWDHAVSVFEMFCHGRSDEFAKWVLKRDCRVPHGFRVHPLDQLGMLPEDPDTLDYIGRFEDMPATWRRIVKEGAKVCKVPSVHKAAPSREPYPSYYTDPNVVLAIWERNQRFVEWSGYEFDPKAASVPSYLPTVRELTT